MKSTIFFLLLVFYMNGVIAQKVDTIFHEPDLYTSYYCMAIKAPLYVVDTLYKTGGDCDRAGDKFVGIKGVTAVNADYVHSGYDIGHLYNAQDAAGDCLKQKRTFKHYNGYPQRHHLNGGIWFRYEDSIRQWSQTEHLFVIAGGIYTSGTFIGKHVAVPDYCWKIVFDLYSHKVIRALICPNDTSGNIYMLLDNGLYANVIKLLNQDLDFEHFAATLKRN